MEDEPVVNGSHEPENDQSEKILKPRKPKHTIVTSKEHDSVIQNGNSETSSLSDITEVDGIKNGHVEDISKQNGNESLLEENELKDGSVRKLRRDSKKESTPKLEPASPKMQAPMKRDLEASVKRDLRRRDTTPRASTPKKHSSPFISGDEPEGKENEVSKSQITDNKEINTKKQELDDVKIKSHGLTMSDESIIILDKTGEEQAEIISINESVEMKGADIVEKSTSIFSIFSKSCSPAVIKDSFEASTSSPSVVCLDSPNNDRYSLPNKEIKGRKPINSFSNFPGRTVSIISLDSSIKRKADSSFDSSETKRFAGDIGSDSEKSPGWHFFSSSWSPKHAESSTPIVKKIEQNSMAVNYDEDNDLSFTVSDVKETSYSKKESKSWCTVM